MNEKLNKLRSKLKITKELLEDAKQGIESIVRGSSKYWQSEDRIVKLASEVEALEHEILQEAGQQTLF